MKREHPLKQSIEKRIEEERYVIPKERKRKQGFSLRWIVVLSVLISLLLILIRLFQFFW